MDGMDVLLLVLVVLLLAAVVAVGVLLVRRGGDHRSAAELAELDADRAATAEAIRFAVDEAVERAVHDARVQAAADRDAAVHAALTQSATLQREQMDSVTQLHREQLDAAAARVTEQSSADLTSKKDVIDARLDSMHAEVKTELQKVSALVHELGQASAKKFGEVESNLAAHAEVTRSLSDSAQSLRTALANPQARGQWGERMAEDVLRLAGFVENVNYVKQTQIEGATGRPDYTFQLPRGQQLFMDVKFPMASYLRYLDATTAAEREAHLKAFLRDVRARVKELARREYASSGSAASIDNVLLFIPNEQLTGFIHEHDPALLDDAMRQQVVMCSPLTLFAFLGVIRQAHDNFMIEQTSDEILKLIGSFGTQWRKYVDQVDTVRKRFESVDKAFDQLAGTRRRALEKPLRQIEEIRLRRGLPVDGELFAIPSDDDETPPDGSVRRLGA